jgi:transcriptional regulator with XRE-family HTH domain
LDDKHQFIELASLAKDRDWSQAEIARQLELSPGMISQYLNTELEAAPSRTVLKLFRILLNQPMALHDSATESERELWRRRAKTAEQKIHELQTGLRKLLRVATETHADTDVPPVHGVSSDVSEKLHTSATTAASREPSVSPEPRRSRPTDAPSGGKQKP